MQRKSEGARELLVTRVVPAPRGNVFEAWTDARQLARWWGPEGFSNPVCEVDPRPGGGIRILMRAPDGTDYPMTGVIRAIVAPESLVFSTVAVRDAMGGPGLETLNVVTLGEEKGWTTLTLRVQVVTATPASASALTGLEEGWRQSLDRLERLVAKS